MSLAVKEILNIGKRHLEESNIADAGIDCKTLYCYLMNVSTVQLILEYQKILPDSLCEAYFKLLELRCSGIPVQYITGLQEFMGFDFNVNEHVLIPRQDTETMVEDAISIIEKNQLRGDQLLAKPKRDFDVLDLCCGSGAIGISIAKLCEKTKVTCADISAPALGVAKENAEKLGVDKKISFVLGNMLMPFKGRFKNKKFDLIISNPPYIKTNVIGSLQREVKDHEPTLALDGGVDGLDCYRLIISEVADYLNKDGILILEIGHDQRDAVIDLLEKTEKFENINGYKDLAGRDRIIVATLASKKRKNND